jgi:hypothetical protein
MPQHRTSGFPAKATGACSRRVLCPWLILWSARAAQPLYRGIIQAASTGALRKRPGPRRVIRPLRSTAPDWSRRGTNPA